MKAKTAVKPKQPNQNPLVSFCISTYKRPEFIKAAVTELLKQTYPHFEVVICDNDPASKLGTMLQKFHSKKIRYHNNHKNLDMVKSFNTAFRLSKGDLIVFMSDDDPPYPFMLEDLVKQYRKHPDCVAYFGAYDLFTPELELAKRTKLKQGRVSCRNFDWPVKAVKIFEPAEYLQKALNGDIFYYLMWSTGFVKRDIVKKVGAIPDYGSALMSDRSYCLKIGTLGKMLIYNRELGIQTVHPQSYSLTSSGAKMLVGGFVGYFKDIQPYLKAYPALQKDHEAFVARHILNMFLIIKVGDEVAHRKTDVIGLMNIFDQISKELPFMKAYRFEMNVMLWQRFPFEAFFKALHMPPAKLAKTSYRFFKYRIRQLSDIIK